MNPPDTRPVVSDVLRETGVSVPDLLSVSPNLSLHMARHLVRGTTTGVTRAKDVAEALRSLAKRHTQAGGRVDAVGARYLRAATQLEAAYPVVPSLDPSEEPEDPDALVIYLAKRQRSFASIGRRVGISRQAVHQRVTAYERRTKEKIPRCGTDY